ncbi:MAG: CopD family protein [Gammaproteobacteria bacterium]|nr:CopD family protein [Gammaproteobacteria bacterium]MDH5727799.1 CopD family protein [Gammaproteobacteria bacterium]
MLWVKAFHLFFVVSWFAGLFYLPRLFVYHAMTDDVVSIERFKIMERKLFAITTMGFVGSLLLGLWLLFAYAWQASQGSYWLHAKLTLVLVLIGYYLWCYRIMKQFRQDQNHRSHVFYRWFNEFPVFLLAGILILVIVRPF